MIYEPATNNNAWTPPTPPASTTGAQSQNSQNWNNQNNWNSQNYGGYTKGKGKSNKGKGRGKGGKGKGGKGKGGKGRGGGGAGNPPITADMWGEYATKGPGTTNHPDGQRICRDFHLGANGCPGWCGADHSHCPRKLTDGNFCFYNHKASRCTRT